MKVQLYIMKQKITTRIFTTALAILLLINGVCSQTMASSCSSDLGFQVYAELKNHLSWVDIHYQLARSEMTLRYYPCSSSRLAIDTLLEEAMRHTSPHCRLISQGIHLHQEGYCVLKKLKVGPAN